MSNIYLAEIVNLHEPSTSDGYPFNIPAIKSLRSLSFTTDVTYFIGENGSGKSTLLEAIAIKMGMNAEGGGRNFNFSTNATHSNLEEELKCVNAVTYLESLKDWGNPFFAYGGESLHHCSHGEGMVRLIENRLECGFYIFDEPEAALSYQNQLRFLLWMHRAVKAGSQLIVSTHSPVLLAYPGAVIYHLNAEGITKTSFKDSYIYNDMRSFVNNVSLVQKELGLLD